MPLDLTDDKSTLAQVMAWCHQATSHYLSQCWPRSMLPNGVTRPQWINDKILLMVCGQCNGCWCPGDRRSQVISRHDSLLVCIGFVGPKFQDIVLLKFQMSWKLTKFSWKLLTHWPLGNVNEILVLKIPDNFSDWWLSYLLWTRL